MEVWELASELWLPMVLEITEALEESLSGRTLRGETWWLRREDDDDPKSLVAGVFTQRSPANALREVFDIKPVIERFYHTSSICWGVANPVPPRTILLPSPGEAPAILRELTKVDEQPRRISNEEMDLLREQARKAGLVPRGPRLDPSQPLNGKKGGNNEAAK